MRRHDWAEQMYRIVTEHTDVAFEWGVNDCCLFVARCVDAMTDSDYESQLHAAYSDKPSALAFIAAHGGLEGAVASIIGPAVEARATRGDVVMIDGGEDCALAVCVGPEVVAVGPNGLRLLGRDSILKAWKVQ